jgi:hypothetical protein
MDWGNFITMLICLPIVYIVVFKFEEMALGAAIGKSKGNRRIGRFIAAGVTAIMGYTYFQEFVIA